MARVLKLHEDEVRRIAAHYSARKGERARRMASTRFFASWPKKRAASLEAAPGTTVQKRTGCA